MGEGSNRSVFSVGRDAGASPSEHRYYVLVMFDISSPKKYRLLIRLLGKYGTRIQKSVFEAQLKMTQIKNLIFLLDKLMNAQQYYNPNDNIRIYKISGNCDVTVFGSCNHLMTEQNIFF